MKQIIYTLGLFVCFALLSPSISAQMSYVSSDYEMQLNDAIIYPNPVTNNSFYVKSEQTIKTVEVINIIGQSIRTVHNETGLPYNIYVTLPECDKGLYMIRIIYEDNKTQIKEILVK